MYTSSVFFYLLLRYLQKRGFDNIILNFASFGISVPIFLCFGLLDGQTIFMPLKYFALTIIAIFFFSYLGNKASLNGTKLAPNPGYSLIIQKSYAIYTTVAAVFLFDSSLTLRSAIAIVIIIAFLVLMNIDFKKKDKLAGTKKMDISNNWLIYSAIAFFAFGNLALYSKWLLNNDVTPFERTFAGQIIVSTFFGLDLLNRQRKKSLSMGKIKNFEWIFFILLGLGNGLFNLFMNLAYNKAPNVGYVNIMNTSSIAAITLFAVLIFKDKLTLQKMAGIIGITAGIVLLVV